MGNPLSAVPFETRDYKPVVRAHRERTVAYVVAESKDARAIRDKEVEIVSGRTLVPLAPDGLVDLDPPGSWVMAVILGRGDTTEEVARWAGDLSDVEADRIWFYEVRDVEAPSAYRAWEAAGLGFPHRVEVLDFVSFHRFFANQLNDRIYLDWHGATE